MTPKVMSGARAKVYITQEGGQPQLIGIFTSVSYSMQLDAQPAYILGRYSAAEIDYVAQEVVSINATGWRVIGHGAHQDVAVPKLEDLLSVGYMTFHIQDRGTAGEPKMMQVQQVRPTGYSTTLSSRQLTEISMTFMGIYINDESGGGVESAGSTNLP